MDICQKCTDRKETDYCFCKILIKGSFFITWGTFVRLHSENVNAAEDINKLYFFSIHFLLFWFYYFISLPLMMSVMQAVSCGFSDCCIFSCTWLLDWPERSECLLRPLCHQGDFTPTPLQEFITQHAYQRYGAQPRGSYQQQVHCLGEGDAGLELETIKIII